MVLSIIIVNWNTVDLLRNCLTSVMENAPTVPYEVLVIDNGSTDDSAEMVARQFPKVQFHEMRENLGFAKANNVGFQLAKGRILLMLNSDTLVHGDVLTRSVDYLLETPHVGAMGCRVLNADGSHQPSAGCFPSHTFLGAQTLGLTKMLPYAFRQAPDQETQAVETLSGCYLMMHRAVLDHVGPLDEDYYFFGEETDWCRRVRAHGFQLHYAPVGQITHFGGGSSAPLNFRRDVMLTNATVRLHRKHKGTVSAILVFLHLLIFNASRGIFWAILNALNPTKERSNRADHFASVVRHYRDAWPKTAAGDAS